MESKKRDERHTLMCVVSLVLHGTGIGCDLQIQLWLWAQVATPSQTIFHLREETPWSKTLAQPNPGKMRVFSFKEALAYPSEMSGFKFPPQVLSVCGGNVAPPATDLSGLKHVIICIVSVCSPSSSTAEQVCTIKEGWQFHCLRKSIPEVLSLAAFHWTTLRPWPQELRSSSCSWWYGHINGPKWGKDPSEVRESLRALATRTKDVPCFEVGVYRCALRIPFFPSET